MSERNDNPPPIEDSLAELARQLGMPAPELRPSAPSTRNPLEDIVAETARLLAPEAPTPAAAPASSEPPAPVRPAPIAPSASEPASRPAAPAAASASSEATPAQPRRSVPSASGPVKGLFGPGTRQNVVPFRRPVDAPVDAPPMPAPSPARPSRPASEPAPAPLEGRRAPRPLFEPTEAPAAPDEPGMFEPVGKVDSEPEHIKQANEILDEWRMFPQLVVVSPAENHTIWNGYNVVFKKEENVWRPTGNEEHAVLNFEYEDLPTVMRALERVGTARREEDKKLQLTVNIPVVPRPEEARGTFACFWPLILEGDPQELKEVIEQIGQDEEMREFARNGGKLLAGPSGFLQADGTYRDGMTSPSRPAEPARDDSELTFTRRAPDAAAAMPRAPRRDDFAGLDGADDGGFLRPRYDAPAASSLPNRPNPFGSVASHQPRREATPVEIPDDDMSDLPPFLAKHLRATGGRRAEEVEVPSEPTLEDIDQIDRQSMLNAAPEQLFDFVRDIMTEKLRANPFGDSLGVPVQALERNLRLLFARNNIQLDSMTTEATRTRQGEEHTLVTSFTVEGKKYTVRLGNGPEGTLAIKKIDGKGVFGRNTHQVAEQFDVSMESYLQEQVGDEFNLQTVQVGDQELIVHFERNNNVAFITSADPAMRTVTVPSADVRERARRRAEARGAAAPAPRPAAPARRPDVDATRRMEAARRAPVAAPTRGRGHERSWKKTSLGLLLAAGVAVGSVFAGHQAVEHLFGGPSTQSTTQEAPKRATYKFEKPDSEMKRIMIEQHKDQILAMAPAGSIASIENLPQIEESLSNLPSLRGRAQTLKAIYQYGLVPFEREDPRYQAQTTEFFIREAAHNEANPGIPNLAERETEAIMQYYRDKHSAGNDAAFTAYIPVTINGETLPAIRLTDVMPRFEPDGQLREYIEPGNLAALNSIYTLEKNNLPPVVAPLNR